MVSSRYSTFGQTEVVVVELQPAALLAAINIERFDRFAQVGELAQEKVPPGLDAADPNRQLDSLAFDQSSLCDVSSCLDHLLQVGLKPVRDFDNDCHFGHPGVGRCGSHFDQVVEKRRPAPHIGQGR
jgi:hypothetical protein